MEDPGRPSWLAIPFAHEIPQPPEVADHCQCDGSVYTLHFDPPYEPYPGAPAYKTAGHYTGHAYDLDRRLAKHEAGQGAHLTRAQLQAGGTWRLADVRPGDRNLERRLKQHSATRRCPICKAEAEQEQEPELG